jgi:tetratricopeptide (TPR) repeat protein
MRIAARALPWLILAVALAVRLVFVAQYRSSPLFAHPIIDALTYHNAAVRLATGGGYAPGAFSRAPLYPTFLAGVYRIAGIGPEHAGAPLPPALAERAIVAAKSAQALLGALSALLVFAIGARLIGRREGAIAGFAFALHPVPVFYTGELFVETLAIALLLGALALLAAALARGSGGAASLEFLGAGALAGLSAIARPTILPAAAALPIALAVVQRPLARGARDALLFALGAAAAIAPVTLRNVRQTGELVLIASQGGVNLWIGNNPLADGTSTLAPGRGRTADSDPSADNIDVASRQIAEAELGRPLRPGEVNDFWAGRAKAWAREHPLDFARLTLRKVAFFWGGAEIWDQQCDVDFLARFSPLLDALLVAQPVSLPTGLVMPFAAVGLALALGRLRRTWLLVWFFAFTAAGVIAFAVTSRYRLPALPFLLLFAALAAGALIDRWRGGGARAALALLVPVAALGALTNVESRRLNPLFSARGRVFAANAWIEAGRPDRARPLLDEAMRIAPAAADPWYALGIAGLAQGDLAAARLAFEETVARDPGFERAIANLGSIAAAEHDWEGALRRYEEALALMPKDETLLANVVQIARDAAAAGRHSVAERALRRVLAARPDDAAAMNSLAWLLAEHLGRARDAVPIAERATAVAPDAAEAHDTLGWALLLSGAADRALPHLRIAHARLGDDPDVAMHLGVALLRAGAAAPAEERALARTLLARAAGAPGGGARRARADSLLAAAR